jgi:hypothetical protein
MNGLNCCIDDLGQNELLEARVTIIRAGLEMKLTQMQAKNAGKKPL